MRLLLLAIASGAILCGLFSTVTCDGGYSGYSSYGNYGGGQIYYDQGYDGYQGYGGYQGYTGMQGYGKGYGKGGGGDYSNYWALNVPYGLRVPPIAPPLGLDQNGLYGGTNNESLWAVVVFGFLLWLLASGASTRVG